MLFVCLNRSAPNTRSGYWLHCISVSVRKRFSIRRKLHIFLGKHIYILRFMAQTPDVFWNTLESIEKIIIKLLFGSIWKKKNLLFFHMFETKLRPLGLKVNQHAHKFHNVPKPCVYIQNILCSAFLVCELWVKKKNQYIYAKWCTWPHNAIYRFNFILFFLPFNNLFSP